MTVCLLASLLWAGAAPRAYSPDLQLLQVQGSCVVEACVVEGPPVSPPTQRGTGTATVPPPVDTTLPFYAHPIAGLLTYSLADEHGPNLA